MYNEAHNGVKHVIIAAHSYRHMQVILRPRQQLGRIGGDIARSRSRASNQHRALIVGGRDQYRNSVLACSSA